MKNPNIGVALPRIPGKSARMISYSDDISVIGAQCGMLATERARATNGVTEAILLIREKLCRLEEMNEENPRLIAQVLGMQEGPKFRSFAFRIRQLRNTIAHPKPSEVLGDELYLALVSEKDRRYVQLLAKWDVASFAERKT
jgi:hypothetical protein